MKAARLISVARGDSPADLLLKNACVINVFTGAIEKSDIVICGEAIAGIGKYELAQKTLDLEGRFVAPGFIDGHTHLESSMLDVGEYARTVVPHGTTAIITDLHEIANVCGLNGIYYILEKSLNYPLDIFLMAPSCVPSTHLETSGAVIRIEEVRKLLRLKRCLGLGEVMNFPGVIKGDSQMLKKIALAKGKIVDGHAPGLRGKDLSAYISAGIMSDHESVSLEEAQEKLNNGMRLMIREGSSEKNLKALLPLVTDKTYRQCIFVVDDRSCSDLLEDGDIDAVVRKAILNGLDPVRAIQLATINTAEYFGLSGMGAIAPGYLANLIVLDNLNVLDVVKVFHRGMLVAENGKALFSAKPDITRRIDHTVHIKPFSLKALRLVSKNKTYPVIEVIPEQIITHKRIKRIRIKSGFVEPDLKRDILKLAVVERHQATGNIGLGLVTGFGLKQGALASSVAHDSHNVVAVGTTDQDIYAAIQAVQVMQGGLVVIKDRKIMACLPLPVAGLLSRKTLETVAASVEKLNISARELGSDLPTPFATLSFLALPVIPELRLTDLGLVDVNLMKLIN
jgi:adenine deaminase